MNEQEQISWSSLTVTELIEGHLLQPAWLRLHQEKTGCKDDYEIESIPFFGAALIDWSNRKVVLPKDIRLKPRAQACGTKITFSWIRCMSYYHVQILVQNNLFDWALEFVTSEHNMGWNLIRDDRSAVLRSGLSFRGALQERDRIDDSIKDLAETPAMKATLNEWCNVDDENRKAAEDAAERAKRERLNHE